MTNENRLTAVEEKMLDIPGGYKVHTVRNICGCVETTIYSPSGGIYRKAEMFCARHGGELVRSDVPGQLDIFTGDVSEYIKKKKGKKK